ncbi:hypothetical protein [Neorhizobium tomejilense]|uniref:hypothetical protein n=1 Tax=Neorhizobium tomejilense TaxID=2093828 RepID=UPI003ECEF98D
MANLGNPAGAAAMGNMAGMAMIAGGAMSAIQGLMAGLDAVNDAVYTRRYGDALSNATAHAREMENLARKAAVMVAELEAEAVQLREACLQQQEVIEVLTARAQ